MVVSPKHPKMIIFSRKTHGCWVPPVLGNTHMDNVVSSFFGCNASCTYVHVQCSKVFSGAT